MAVDNSTLILLPNYKMFARPVTITPIASQPGQPAYSARGIFGTRSTDIIGEDGSVYSDQQTILDIREAEFTVRPIQLDRINIPVENAIPAEGDFEVASASANGGGETTLILRKIVP